MGKSELRKAIKQFDDKYGVNIEEIKKKHKEARAKGIESYSAWLKQQKENSFRKSENISEEAWFNDIFDKLSYQSRFRMLARGFWQSRFDQNRISTIAFNTDEDSPSNYRQAIIRFINGKPSNFDSTKYYQEVKPQLNWERIDRCFSGINIHKDKVDTIVMVLKPLPFATEFTIGYPQLITLVESTCKDIEPLIQQLDPIPQRLQSIPYPYRDLLPKLKLYEIGPQIKDLVYYYQTIIRVGKKIPDMHFYYFGIEKTKYKMPQKHKFWTYAIGGAAYELNKYCHGEYCPNKPCNQTHDIRVFPVIAQLLKILYPTIWTENLTMITKNISTRGRNFIDKYCDPSSKICN